MVVECLRDRHGHEQCQAEAAAEGKVLLMDCCDGGQSQKPRYYDYDYYDTAL